MKVYLLTGLLLVSSLNLFAQRMITEDGDDSLKDFSELGFNVEHYNWSDTAKNEFAAKYIYGQFKSLNVLVDELQEAPITNSIEGEQHLFRIASLPTFNHPICFTITARNDQYYLSWTIGKGSGGYDPKGIKVKGKIQISGSDWIYFKKLIDINAIDTLPLATYSPILDGTSWIIEKNINDSYKIYFSNELPARVQSGFDLLLHISKVKIKEIKHFVNNEEFSFFDSNNILIDLDPIRKTVISTLNHDFRDKLSNKDYCFDCGLYVKVTSRQKIKSVKYIPYTFPYLSLADRLEYYHENYTDRKILHQVKKSLRKLYFTHFNLSKSIWIPVYIKYNKKTGLLEIDKE